MIFKKNPSFMQAHFNTSLTTPILVSSHTQPYLHDYTLPADHCHCYSREILRITVSSCASRRTVPPPTAACLWASPQTMCPTSSWTSTCKQSPAPGWQWASLSPGTWWVRGGAGGRWDGRERAGGRWEGRGWDGGR